MEKTNMITTKSIKAICERKDIPIFEKQNDELFITLHLAKDWFYIESEKAWRIGFWASLLYGILLVALYFVSLESMTQPIELITGLIGFFFAGLLKYRADDMKKKGAIVQEQLDTCLFAIPTNEVLLPDGFIRWETILEKSDKSNAPKSRFTDWYSAGTAKNEDFENQVLRCQRENISFDYGLRQKYTQRFFWIFAILSSLIVGYGIIGNLPVREFLINLLLPFSGFLMLVGKTWLDNRQIIRKQESKEQVICNKLKALSNDQSKIDNIDLREIQDFIFENRASKAVTIPNGYYEKYRDELDQLIIRGTNLIDK